MGNNKDNPGKGPVDKETKKDKKHKLVVDVSTGEETLVEMTDEEIASLETVVMPEPEPGVDKEALARAINDCKNLERLKDFLIKDILPLL